MPQSFRVRGAAFRFGSCGEKRDELTHRPTRNSDVTWTGTWTCPFICCSASSSSHRSYATWSPTSVRATTLFSSCSCSSHSAPRLSRGRSTARAADSGMQGAYVDDRGSPDQGRSVICGHICVASFLSFYNHDQARYSSAIQLPVPPREGPRVQ